jgi:nitrite reductase (NADH) small subunit
MVPPRSSASSSSPDGAASGPKSGPDERESMSLGEIREDALNVKVLRSGQKAIVIRRGAQIHAFSDVCPHMGADLAEAKYCAKEGTLQCRWHGYFFGADDGKFLRNPNEDFMQLLRVPSKHFVPAKTPRYRLTIIPTSQKDGRLFFGREDEPGPQSAAAEAGQP